MTQPEVAKKEFLNKEIAKRGVPVFTPVIARYERNGHWSNVWIKCRFLWDLCELLFKGLSS